MNFLFRARIAIIYIIIEMLPSFFLGLFVFVFILIMFQTLRLTEFVLVHGVNGLDILQMMGFLTISFLPIILPMSLLFSVLLTYGRLSGDSEIVAMKSLGLNLKHLSVPAVIFGLVVTIISAQASFFMAPWGNRRFELMISDLSKIKASASIKEGVFSEGFFDMVIYASRVNTKENHLEKVFIFDERDPKSPLTIIAKEGQILQAQKKEGNFGLLRLTEGNIHRTNEFTYTKINFRSYDINLFDPTSFEEKKKSLLSYTLDDIQAELKNLHISISERRQLEIELHRRSALASACIIFSLLGMGFGTSTNRRSARGGDFAICLAIIISYWVVYIALENTAKNNLSFPVAPLIWLTNFVFSGITLWSLHRASRA